ncbi:NADPH oxidase activator 1 isoform X3 [Mauremys mutica]|uniref:NADPH oxidase activator 1 isoform X3 n=1 Tax=Mauremys mutica TaxID=74926 RepID=UPI001D16E32E|nr:NADPH oxidase activator 1 isoform X3 [Mauremys mutica]
MAYRDLVRGWHEGILAMDKGDWDSALKIFSSIEEPSSRIYFNIGCVHLLTGNLEGALQAFDKTVTKDNHLAVGFFQRGFVCLQLEMYEEALYDFRMALTHLRNNPFIDYKQLGLRHMLCAWEVLYNTAAVQCRLGLWQEARITLEEAIRQRPEGRTTSLDVALEWVQNHLFLEPIHVPLGEFFRPRKEEVEQLDSKDFLGKPKVISSVIPNDEYIGFEPLRPQRQGFYEPSVNAVRDRSSGYYRVVTHYYPEDSEEMAVKSSTIIFVLTKGADGWATAISDGQKLRIPTSHLEPVYAPKADKWKVSNGIPLPPIKVPPNRPHVQEMDRQQQGPAEGEDTAANDADLQADLQVQCSPTSQTIKAIKSLVPKQVPLAQDKASSSENRSILLKVHCDYTVKVNKALTLSDLRSLLRETFSQQAELGKLSCRLSDSKELIVISGEEELGQMWQQVTDGRLTLWCQGTDACSDRPVLYRMVAHHGYTAQRPEDLEFSEGDTLDILSEVNEEWLEGHCNGNFGIFPKCFAAQASIGAACP